MNDKMYTFFFKGFDANPILISVKGEIKLYQLIKIYLERIKRLNLLVRNIDKIYFVYNATKIKNEDLEKAVYEYFNYYNNNITVINGYNSRFKYEIIETIKDNLYTTVYKAKSLENYSDYPEFVAIKKIKKDKRKEEMRLTKVKMNITEEDFRPKIEKFNREIQNMEKCYCENSVKIYDYYDNENEFIIIMELCDETLYDVLCKKPKNIGFSPEEIKIILLQLNNVFKLMNKNNISNRDIKLNNILVKYENKEKNKFRILISDYGVSNQISSLTQQLMTHVGTLLIMAPEILNNKPYNNKCDLWSLGVNIYLLYTKEYPYSSPIENGILNQIDKKGKSILNAIKDKSLKDLLSKLLTKDPKKRISWEKYFQHPFFGGNGNIDNNSCIIY